jgi:hypothetical protein
MLLAAAALPLRAAQSPPLELSCQSISNRTTPAELRQRYGAANVIDSPSTASADAEAMPWTVLFPDEPERRVDIVWTDASRTRLASFMTSGRKGLWRTPQGIKPGQAIADVMELNGRAFVLAGFSQPNAGEVISWMGGKLAEADAGPCRVVVRLTPPPDITFTTLEWRLAEIVADAPDVSSDDRRIKPYKAAVSSLGLAWK